MALFVVMLDVGGEGFWLVLVLSKRTSGYDFLIVSAWPRSIKVFVAMGQDIGEGDYGLFFSAA